MRIGSALVLRKPYGRLSGRCKQQSGEAILQKGRGKPRLESSHLSEGIHAAFSRPDLRNRSIDDLGKSSPFSNYSG